MTGAKPPMKEQNKVEKLGNVTARATQSSVLCNDDGHVTFADEVEQRLHATKNCRLVPELT